jgi:hypothetical protein
VRAIDLRYLERWSVSRRTPPLRQMGVDEIHLGKKQKFLTVVSGDRGQVRNYPLRGNRISADGRKARGPKEPRAGRAFFVLT